MKFQRFVEYTKPAITAYVAGSAADQNYLRHRATEWVRQGIAVVSSWLWGPYLSMPVQRAVCSAVDTCDLLGSDILVVCANRTQSTTGGFWTEFGMFLTQNKPVIVACRSNCNNPFVHHPNVVRFHNRLSCLTGADIKKIHRHFYRPSA